jgi:hypothetical protein
MSPIFKQPLEIGAFSLDISLNFDNSRNQLKFFIKPQDLQKVEFDLQKGYRNMIRKDDSKPEYIDNILRWITNNPDEFGIKGTDEGTSR